MRLMYLDISRLAEIFYRSLQHSVGGKGNQRTVSLFLKWLGVKRHGNNSLVRQHRALSIYGGRKLVRYCIVGVMFVAFFICNVG